eukprot:4080594-Amphidinium_carterae.2
MSEAESSDTALASHRFVPRCMLPSPAHTVASRLRRSPKSEQVGWYNQQEVAMLRQLKILRSTSVMRYSMVRQHASKVLTS